MKIKNSCYVLQEQVWITVENYVKVAEVKMNMDIFFCFSMVPPKFL